MFIITLNKYNYIKKCQNLINIQYSENGEHTCEECRKLDGREFDFYDEVPERPHPNCKCRVEIVEGEIESNTEKSQDEKDKVPSDIATSQPILQMQTVESIMQVQKIQKGMDNI